jgi:hypothetical protein
MKSWQLAAIKLALPVVAAAARQFAAWLNTMTAKVQAPAPQPKDDTQ